VEGRFRGAAGVVDTLLGPERTRAAVLFPARFSLFRPISPYITQVLPVSPGVAGVWCGCRGGGWLLFENYTVDASIFVAKLLRAHGGCLGTRSR
jgi:hypothetical protein